jgi:hypothetical protein
MEVTSVATGTGDLVDQGALVVKSRTDIISLPFHQSMFTQRAYPSGAVPHPEPPPFVVNGPLVHLSC